MSTSSAPKSLAGVAALILKLREEEKLEAIERQFPTQVKAIIDSFAFVSSSYEARLDSSASPQTLSFLQELASDDVILKILDFLDAFTLKATFVACSRFHRLTRSAVKSRLRGTLYSSLFSPSQLLYVKDRLDLAGVYKHSSEAPLLFIGLSQRVVVSGAGVEEVNGIYQCTSCSAYGFEFSKINDPAFESGALTFAITKRFSNDQLIWYIGSRVVPRTTPRRLASNSERGQLFQYHAPLIIGVREIANNPEAPDPGYPPTTEDLRRQNASWMALRPSYHPPPTVTYYTDETYFTPST